MNIVIPMAGLGTRFQEKGYTLPKPFLKIQKNLNLIQLVLENLALAEDKVILIAWHEHLKYFNFPLPPNTVILPQQTLLRGAAHTVLLAKEFINNDEPLMIANSDQYIIYDQKHYRHYIQDQYGVIMTFKDIDSRWSFAKVENGMVVEVAEKNPISDNATCGVYYYSKGKDFIAAAEDMIEKNIKVNNEFYVCPVYNEYIKENPTTIYEVEMLGLGTPEDFEKNIIKFL